MSDQNNPPLFASEVLDEVEGFPVLYRYFPAQNTDKPLAVFIPGGAHLARVSYGGHKGSRDADFLAPWLQKQGFGFLAVSYPLETEFQVMSATCPGFRIRDWGRQAAAVAKKVIQSHELSSKVILVSWSMGGRVVIPFVKTAEEVGLQVELYVSLAATPGLPALPGGHPGRHNIHCTKAGYAQVPVLLNVFIPQIQAQAKLNNTQEIIPEDVFAREYYGNTPISMLGWLLKHDEDQPDFVDDGGLSISDAEATDFARFPWIATLYPNSEQDTRHALADKATWNFLFSLRLTGVVEKAKRKKPIGDAWNKVFALVASIPDRLTTCVEGNHYFFLGEKGAVKTANLISQHWETSQALKAELAGLLGLSIAEV